MNKTPYVSLRSFKWKIIDSFACALGFFFGFLEMTSEIGAVIIHLWTVKIAAQFGGVFAGALTFAFPPFSEIYWFIKLLGPQNQEIIAYRIAIISVILAMLVCKSAMAFIVYKQRNSQ